MAVGQTTGGVVVDPSVQIRLVRENLGLAIALWAAAQRGVISAGFVPNQSKVESPSGELVRVSSGLEVHDSRDLIRCVNNQIRGAFAFSALQTNRALESVYGNSPIRDAASEIQAARCIVFLLSKTVTDELMSPVWVCPPEYRRTFEVPSASFTLNALSLNGKKVSWDDFGGLSQYLDLLEFCSNQTANHARMPQHSSQDLENTEKELPEPESVPSDYSVTDSVTLDSISSFVEARCLVGARELVIAKELFNAYLAWCASEGYEALGQRSFGMRLTNLGFERRRRGKGKHWWMGVSLTESPVAASTVAG